MLRSLVLITALVLSQVSRGDEHPLLIYTVNYPLHYFAERIVGDHGTVRFPAPPDIDPAFWSPSPENINDYQQADLIILNGAGYAGWIRTATLSPLRLVDTSSLFSDQLILAQDATTHTHGPSGDHSHAGVAFTTWLDFKQAAQHAEVIKDTLVRTRPAHAGAFESNFAALKLDLLPLDEELSRIAQGFGDKKLLASHPVYQYLARRYGLNVTSLLWEPDTMPDQAEWAGLEDLLASHSIDWMLWEAEPLPEIRQRLDALNIGVIVFDPSFNKPDQGDFLEVMARNIDNLRAVNRGQYTF